MNFIDSHAHLYLPDFAGDIEQVIQQAKHAGITKILLPNIDGESISAMEGLAAAYPGFFHSMMGLHPTSVKENYLNELKLVEEALFSRKNYVAVGEIGIDLYWDKSFFNQQKEAFSIQMRWANELDLPLVIHSRDSFQEIFMELEKVKHLDIKGVFHSFTGTLEDAKKIIEKGFYIGINGIVTFKNAKLREIIREIGLENILLETDAPYLAPDPFRGKRNESAYLIYTAMKIAEIYECSLEELAEKTTTNAKNLFKLN